MVEARNELGGYTVPVDWQASVIQRLKGLVVMRGKATGVQTSRDAVEYPTATGGDAQYTSAIRETMVDETPSSSAADTNLTWGQEKIPIHTAMAVARLSRNWLEDSAVNVASFLAEKFAEAGAINEDNQFLTGDGNGRAQGLLPSSGNGLSLTEAVTTDADYMKWDGLINLVYAPNSQYRGRCIFIGEKNTYRDIAKLKDSNGQYLWRDRFGNNVSEGGGPTRLMTYETYEQEAMPTITAGAYVLLFGDPTGYLIADRIGMTVERYLDSSTAEINQVTFIMRRRFGGQPVETWKWAVQKVAAS
jgi:HK97 family phage major capsid protein